MASVICVERDDGWHAVAELSGLQDTPHLIRVVQERFAGHHITIYPDASGKSRKTVNASESDISLLRQAKFRVKVDDSNPAVKDRILAVNTGFDKRRLWINDAKCPSLAEALEQQAYDKNGEPDKSGGHDHQVDALGYFVNKVMPVKRRVASQQRLGML